MRTEHSEPPENGNENGGENGGSGKTVRDDLGLPEQIVTATSGKAGLILFLVVIGTLFAIAILR